MKTNTYNNNININIFLNSYDVNNQSHSIRTMCKIQRIRKKFHRPKTYDEKNVFRRV